MAGDLFLEERRRLILEQLKRDGRVSVTALSALLQVSAVTIRHDLRHLEEAGLLERTYGGAVLPIAEQTGPELSFDIRQRRAGAEKEAIARAAAALLHDDATLMLDASTTAFALVPHLKTFRRLNIITNSLMVAQSLLDAPQVQVLMPGGRLRRDSIALVGGLASLPDINVNIGFFGTRGLTAARGFTDSDPEEADIKRALVAHCLHPVIVADQDKWGKIAPYVFADATSVRTIVTTAGAPPDQVAAFTAQGIRVIQVAVS